MTKCFKIRLQVSVSGPMVLWFSICTLEININSKIIYLHTTFSFLTKLATCNEISEDENNALTL